MHADEIIYPLLITGVLYYLAPSIRKWKKFAFVKEDVSKSNVGYVKDVDLHSCYHLALSFLSHFFKVIRRLDSFSYSYFCTVYF